MMHPEKWPYAEIVDFLVDRPGQDRRRWATAWLMCVLRMNGQCRYRDRSERLGDAICTTAARESLTAAIEALTAPERAFAFRLVLLVPWERMVRDTGLRLRIAHVVEVLGDVAPVEELVTAAGHVVESGPGTLRDFPLDDLLPEVRRPGQGLVCELPPEVRKQIGTTATQIEFDYLTVAASNFRPFGWEANLRFLLPWWLDAIDEGLADRTVDTLLDERKTKAMAAADPFGRLGLLDWARDHPEHPRVDGILRQGLDGKTGDIRKAAAALALALGRTNVLETMARKDPDKGVRRRAEKLLREAAEAELLRLVPSGGPAGRSR